MVQGRIDIVDSNCVDTKLLHEGCVTETTGAIAQRVSSGCSTERVRTAWLVAGNSVSCIFSAIESLVQHTQHQ